MQGTVIKYLVKTNDKIKTNQEVAIIESMKMETTIKSDVDGTILEILIAPGGVIQAQEPIIKIN
jgi:biotin carboxyl carrier protein